MQLLKSVCDLNVWIGNIPDKHGRFSPRQSLIRDGSRTNLSPGMQEWQKRWRKTKTRISLLQRRRLLPISRTPKATSTIRTDCGRFTIMNSWTIRLFEKLTSAEFAPRVTIIDGTGGFTSVYGPPSAPRGSKATSSNAA